MRKVNEAGIQLIKQWEGLVDGNRATLNLDPYVDPIGILTIGYGHAITFGERFLRNNPKDRKISRKLYPHGITPAEAEALLKQDIADHTRELGTLIKVPVTDNQYAAIASLAFNIGVANFKRSSVLAKLNQGKYRESADRFLLWNKGTFAGRLVQLRGLVRRREAERKLFLTD